jgi:putative aldouronate transport system substrate-binding protein
MKKYRIVFLTVLFACAASLAFAAGSKEESAGTGVQMNPVGTLPLVKEKVTLSVLVPTTPQTDDFTDNAFSQWLEERTNVQADFQVVSGADYDQKLNVLLASGDYPGVMLHTRFNLTELQLYGSEGILMPLNDYIDTWGHEFKRVMEEYPLVESVSTLPDGNIYGLANVTGSFHGQASVKMWVYMPWLEKLGMDIPQTTEEFEAMLTAFKENDLNGNGKPDEIPLAGSPSGYNSQIDRFLMNSFIYNDIWRDRSRTLVRDGTIIAAFSQPEWREGLRYIKGLYDKGLLAAESFTQDAAQLKQLGENPGEVILGTVPGLYQGVFTNPGGESGRWAEYRTIPPLKGPKGVQLSWYYPWGMVNGDAEFVITDTCEYPEVAFRWGDAMYNLEASMRSNYGRPGKEWRWVAEDEGLLGMDGQPAKWDLIVGINQQEKNIHWNHAGPLFLPYDEIHSRRVASETSFEPILYEATAENYMPYVPDEDTMMPLMAIDPDAVAELADVKTTILSYVDETIARFIVGDLDLDSDWDAYLNELETIGLERYLEIYQTAYDELN